MDSESKLYLERAENELLLAKTNFDISIKNQLKGILGIPKEKTFFNDVISQAYYAIFYSAKAYLTNRGIKTSPPEEHKKTYGEFKKLVYSNKLRDQLLEIYEKETEKAEVLLKIFFSEKRKRGIFTYNVKSEANIPSAMESIENAKTFISSINEIIMKPK